MKNLVRIDKRDSSLAVQNDKRLRDGHVQVRKYAVCSDLQWYSCFSFAMVIPKFRRISPEAREIVYWILVFILGALGTTLISLRMHEYVFTWPVCLFAAYQGLMDRLAINHRQLTRGDRLRSGIAFVVFLLCCVLYFLVCRRLSLVFEWVFLSGFVAAIPFSLIGKVAFQRKPWHWLWKKLWIVLAFTAFFWSSVGFLYLRVR